MATIVAGPVTAQNTATRTTATVTAQAGDVLVVLGWNENATPVAPSRPASVGAFTTRGTGTPNRANKYTTAVFTADVLTSGSHALTPAGSTYNGIIVYAVRGVTAVSAAVSTEQTARASQTAVGPTDAVAAGSVLLGIWTSYTNGSSTPTYSSAPTGMTEASDENPGAINYARVMTAHQTYIADVAATGSKTATVSGTTTGYWSGSLVLLSGATARPGQGHAGVGVAATAAGTKTSTSAAADAAVRLGGYATGQKVLARVGTATAALRLGAAARGTSTRQGAATSAVTLVAHGLGTRLGVRIGRGHAGLVLAATATGRAARAGAAPARIGSTATAAGTSSRAGRGAGATVAVRTDGAGTALRSGTATAGRLRVAMTVTSLATRQTVGQAPRLGVRARPAAASKRGIGAGWAPTLLFDERGVGSKRGIGAGWTPHILLAAGAHGPSPIPRFTGRPLPEDPLPLNTARYLVQNILTGEWLHTDLPLTDDTVTRTLSGPCEITGTLAVEYADLETPDGSPLLRSWGHVVYLELDGEIRGAGLITEDSYDDQTQTLLCRGVSAYPGVVSYQGRYRRYFADPLDVVTDMWNYVQSFPNGDLGVQVARSGGRPRELYGDLVSLIPGDALLGVNLAPTTEGNTGDDQPIIPVQASKTLPAVYARLAAAGFRTRALIDPAKPATEPGNTPPANTLFVTKAGLAQAYADHFTTSSTVPLSYPDPPDQTSSVTIEPFRVDWWDGRDVGSIIDAAARMVPADYVEQYTWNFPRTFVEQTVLFAYPRLGRRRDDLRFVQGENIVSPPALEFDPDAYASCVIGIGAGEGSEALREVAEVIVPGKLRKTYVYTNTTITDRSELRRLVASELARRASGGLEVRSIVVQASHDNARFGEYSEGDDIPVDIEVPSFGRVQQWSRVMSMTLARGADLVEIALQRSDSFRYGRERETSAQ